MHRSFLKKAQRLKCDVCNRDGYKVQALFNNSKKKNPKPNKCSLKLILGSPRPEAGAKQHSYTSASAQLLPPDGTSLWDRAL